MVPPERSSLTPDEEKGLSTTTSDKASRSDEEALHIHDGSPTSTEQPSHPERKYGVFAPIAAKLFDLGVESRGIERVPEDERSDKYFWNK